MRIEQQNTCGVILAGGAGSRVQGLDKGLMDYHGKPLIEKTIQRLEPQTGDIVISANRNISEYKHFANKVVSDGLPDYQGPIAGICAALNILLNEDSISAVLVCSCDTPLIPKNLFERLRNKLSENDLVAVATDGVRAQNLHCLIKRGAWLSLIEFFNGGGRAMYQWHKKTGAIEVDFSDQASAFLNINSQDQV